MTFKMCFHVDSDLATLLLVLLAATVIWTLWCILRRRLLRTRIVTLAHLKINWHYLWMITLAIFQELLSELTFSEPHPAPTSALELGNKMQPARQAIWKIAPTYSPYRKIVCSKSSLGMFISSAVTCMIIYQTTFTSMTNTFVFDVKELSDRYGLQVLRLLFTLPSNSKKDAQGFF